MKDAKGVRQMLCARCLPPPNASTNDLQRAATFSLRADPAFSSCAPSARATCRILTPRCIPPRHSMARVSYNFASRSEWGVSSMMLPNISASGDHTVTGGQPMRRAVSSSASNLAPRSPLKVSVPSRSSQRAVAPQGRRVVRRLLGARLRLPKSWLRSQLKPTELRR